MKRLVDEFQKDYGAKDMESQAFLRNYFVGDRSPELEPFWPEYTCALDNHTAAGFSKCVCANQDFK